MSHSADLSHRSHVLQSYRCRVPAQLGWWDGTGIVPARIKKISRVGATIEAGQLPPDSASLWVRIEDGPGAEWAEARIVAVEESSGFPWIGRGSYEIQVMFAGQQPDRLFRAVFDDLARPLADLPAFAEPAALATR